MTAKWTKVRKGEYLYGDTGYGAASSWKQSSARWEALTGEVEVSGVEWAATKAEDNLAWFDTLRETKGFVEATVKERAGD